MMKLTTSLLAITLAVAMAHTGALAQTATETECATALETLNTQINQNTRSHDEQLDDLQRRIEELERQQDDR